MFDPTKEVPSLELCKKLKELGYPQDGGGWYWIKYQDEWVLVLSIRVDKSEELWSFYIGGENPYVFRCPAKDEVYKAPGVYELEQWLPYAIIEKGKSKFWLFCTPYNPVRWNCGYSNHSEVDVVKFGRTIVEGMARLLLWLAEKGDVKFLEAATDVNGE